MVSTETGQASRRSLWDTFSAAPHRMMFFGGAVQLVATLTYWSVELIGRYTSLWAAPVTTLPSTWAHAFLMLYGLFLFFIFGFLMTTYPRWMNGPPVHRREYAGTFFLMAGGMVLFYLGLFTVRALAGLGVASYLAGWALGIRALLRVFAAAPAKDKHYERWLNTAHLCGWLGALAYLVWIFSPQWWLLMFSLRVGLWLFLVPVFATVSHRMLPFFSYCALPNYTQVQPRWSLPLLAAGVAGHVALELLGERPWLFLFDAPLAVWAFWHTIAWNLMRSLHIRLLAVLHIAFLGFGIGMTLYAAQSLMLLGGLPDYLGRAPLHVLGIGFFAVMVVGMATRVSLGHSGRELTMDTYAWICFWGVEAVAVLRVLSEFPALNRGINLLLVAALGWLLFMGAWAVRYVPFYLRPRIDNNPG